MKRKNEHLICNRCIMDTTDPKIEFDNEGICNHCNEYDKRKNLMVTDINLRENALHDINNKIKIAGKGNEYDCIIGVSGGIDSSYVVYLAKKLGLRGLLVHLDNGWNSELAVKNIENLVNYSGFDLYTLVIDWDEFKDLQRAFFHADVIDLELLSDHAIFATVYKLARKYKVKYLLSGENFETEAIMASSWNWRKSDATNIKDIHSKFGSRKIKTFPFMSTARKLFYTKFGIIKSIPILDYIDYDKDSAIDTLEREVGWKYYGGKHFESIFTRFYQGFILPEKFKVDKRKAHYSTLINSGRITRQQALSELQQPTYSQDLVQQDKKLLCKKLNFTVAEFNDYLNRDSIPHENYLNDTNLNDLLLRFNKFLKKMK